MTTTNPHLGLSAHSFQAIGNICRNDYFNDQYDRKWSGVV